METKHTLTAAEVADLRAVVMRRFGAGHYAIDDLIGVALLRACEVAPKYDGRGSFFSFALVCGINAALDWLKLCRNRFPHASYDTVDESGQSEWHGGAVRAALARYADQPSPLTHQPIGAASLSRAQDHAALRRAIASLTGDARVAGIMSYCGRSGVEIAKALGASEPTASRRRQDAFTAIRGKICR